MSFIAPLDQPGPDELRWEEIARNLEEFRSKTVSLSDEFSLAIPPFREQGTPLPANWARQYVDWSERRAQLATEIASGLGVASVSEQSFSDWNRSIDQRQNELRAVREREVQAITEVVNVVQRVQGLQSTDAQLNSSDEMDQARMLATILLEKLSDPATRAVVMEDSGTLKGLRAVLVLIDGTSVSETEELAVADVEAMFGRKLSIALLRGRVTAPAP